MTISQANHAPNMKTRLFLRHGTWELNLWAHMTGNEAAQIADNVVTEEMSYTMGLLAEGDAIRGRWPVKAVLFSPYEPEFETGLIRL